MTTKIDPVRKIATALVVTAAVLTAGPAAAAPAPVAAARAGATASPFVLPAPGGSDEIGRDVLHLVDRARRDPWVPSGPRELMVSMFYPAAKGPGRPAGYLTVTEARMFLEHRGLGGVIAPEALAGARTTARAGAHPLRGRYPLVVLSPGFSLHRHTLTALAEELASRGYVVAAVDHAYESAGTAFPGGRALPCTACDLVDGRESMAAVAENRARDVSFLLDRLTAPRPAWRHAGLIDRGRIGMAGHSIGGAAASATMAADRRVRAGINMDGTIMSPVPAGGLDRRPFLLFGTSAHAPGVRPDETWDRDWPKLDGWKRWLTVTGVGHLDFSDTGVLADQAGLPDDGSSPLPGDRTVAIVRAYVAAFFDLHLRGKPQPLLDGPSAADPEVVFHQP